MWRKIECAGRSKVGDKARWIEAVSRRYRDCMTDSLLRDRLCATQVSPVSRSVPVK